MRGNRQNYLPLQIFNTLKSNWKASTCSTPTFSSSLSSRNRQNQNFSGIHSRDLSTFSRTIYRSQYTTSKSPERELLVQHFHKDEIDGATYAVITFNRGHAANAVGRTMLSQMQEAISSLKHDTDHLVRCVILTSSSPRVFSAGADLRERSKMNQDEAASFVTELRQTMDGLASLPMPVIAVVEGVAVGGGLEIALTSDLIVAGRGAKFGLPETSLAIIPGAGGTQRLPRLIGAARAKELIYTGRRISAETAHEYGLVQHVVDPGCADAKALEIVNEIIKNGPIAVRAAKSSILEGLEARTIADAMEVERRCYQTTIPTSDRLEGLAAFREKRKPSYKGV